MTDRTRRILEDQLRSARRLDNDVFAKINLSTNSIRDTTRRMVEVFAISIADLNIFLREDRDARELPQ